MMKMRFALTSTATAVALSAFAALPSAAEAQSVSGSIYYPAAPQPVYAPPPAYVYPPVYYAPAPAYYYAPAPVYYYPQPVYYAQPGFQATYSDRGRNSPYGGYRGEPGLSLRGGL